MIICGNVVFGVGNINFGLAVVVSMNLFFVGDNQTSFLGIAGNGGNSDWEFVPPAAGLRFSSTEVERTAL